ncbi:20057_t:CDS:2 [Gigaspora rosea]|nr:20057_t:CDS:2 [Gigaspora rosea]
MITDLRPSIIYTFKKYFQKYFKKDENITPQTSSDDNTISPNQPEPLFPFSRAFIITMFLLFLIAFFVILIFKMIVEESAIKISYDESPTSVPLPNSDCNDTIFFDNNHSNNSWYFLPNGNITLQTDQAFSFCIFNNDNTFNDLITLTVYDPKTSYDNPPFYVNSFIDQSTYFLAPETNRTMYYSLSFRRKKRQDMDNSPFTIMGVPPNYDHKTFYYIESGIKNVPVINSFNFTNNFSNVAILTVSPWTCTIEIEKEQKNRTLIDIIANTSAIYSVMLVIYLFLFKKEIAEPFGVFYWVDDKFRNKVKKQPDLEANDNNVIQR